MYIPLLIIGTSYDGIGNFPYLPSSLEDARETFGYYITERKVIGAQDTSVQLSYDILGERYSIFQNIGGIIVKEPLYSPAVSGTAPGRTDLLTFGNPAVSGEYYINYVRAPYEDDLFLALERVLAQNPNNFPYLLRIEGDKANTTIGTLYLEAAYSGEKYNGITISVTGSTLTIYYPSLYRQSPFFTYSTTNLQKLAEEINSDYSYNLHPVKASVFPNNPSLPPGTYTLTGGQSYSLTPDRIVSILGSLDLNEIGIILLAGGQPQDVIQAALDYINNNSSGPTCLVVGDPVSLMSDTSDQYQSFLLGLSYNSNRLFYVPGWGVLGPELKWTSLSSTFAGLLNSVTSSPTHKSSSIQDLYPYWSADQLRTLGKNYCVFTRFIQSGFAPYRSCPTDGSSPLVAKVKLDIARRIITSLDSYIGEPAVDIDKVLSTVGDALDGLNNISDLKYSCEVALSTITITISVKVYGEVRYITMSISTKLPSPG